MTEDQLQILVAQYLDTMGWRWCHVANERKTSLRAGGNLKRKGVKKGVPDCLIFEPITHETVVIHTRSTIIESCGIAIELKSAKGRVTKEQSAWLEALSKRGWITAVCRTLDEVIEVCKVLT